MLPWIEFFGLSIPSYWLCAVAGLVACSIAAFVRHKNFNGLQSVDLTNSAALLFVGVICGGRLLSMITQVPVAIRNWELFSAQPGHLLELFGNGLVFYGGLFGALAALSIYVTHYGLDLNQFLDFFVPLFPLFHAFGRIGCFLNGCCHGFVSEQFGIAFEASASAPNGVPFFPIQLVCAALNLLLFLWLWHFEARHHLEGKTLAAYLALYATGRFCVEFFRGDTIRGIFFGLSTSQWISFAVLLILAIRFIKQRGIPHSVSNRS